MTTPEVIRAEHGGEALLEPEIEEDVFRGVLKDAVAALDEAGIAYALIGGLACGLWGRPRWTHDIDLFVKPTDAKRALHALADRGFATEETDHSWIYKAWRDDVLVDLIFRITGDIYLDEVMGQRLTAQEIHGIPVKVIPPEDLLVIKAVVFDEKTPRHWYDALAIVARSELDWDYLVQRAKPAGKRVLSLLLFAQSKDRMVPQQPIRALFAALYDDGKA